MDGIRRLLAILLILLASYFGLSAKAIIFLTVLIFVILFVVIPLFFHFNAYIQRQMVFLTWVKWPKLVDFNKPEAEGLLGTINFYLESEPGVKIGVWHVLPSKLIEESEKIDVDQKEKKLKWFADSLSHGDPIVIYMHGNTASRARDHRTDMYNVLRKLGYHVIAFDYRGYADSAQKTPTKRGVVTDGHAIYNYVKNHSGKNDVPVIVWGHSLGSAVASQVVSDLCLSGNPPKALVLESPFNNIRDEIKIHPMTFLWRKMPFFKWLFTGSLAKSDVGFFSDEVIQNIHIPILILHARDDHVVPFVLGEKLYKTAKASRLEESSKSSKPLFFVPFDEEHGFAHVLIHMSPELPSLVSNFITRSITDEWNQEHYQGKLL